MYVIGACPPLIASNHGLFQVLPPCLSCRAFRSPWRLRTPVVVVTATPVALAFVRHPRNGCCAVSGLHHARHAANQLVGFRLCPPTQHITSFVSPSPLHHHHQMDKKVSDAADEYSDATRLCQARSAIRQLKADIKAMDVLIGAKSATLMGKQLGRQHAGEGEHASSLC